MGRNSDCYDRFIFLTHKCKKILKNTQYAVSWTTIHFRVFPVYVRGQERRIILRMWLKRWKNIDVNCIHYDDLVCHPVTILSILTLSSPVTEWSMIHSEEVPWTLHWKVSRVVHVVRHTLHLHTACRVWRVSPSQSDTGDTPGVNTIGAI